MNIETMSADIVLIHDGITQRNFGKKQISKYVHMIKQKELDGKSE